MSHQPETKLHNLPRQASSFIGRETEIAQINKLLTDPACRLLTVTGAGGIGKTRLAIQAAATVSDDFDQGLYFVPLQGIDAGEFLVPAVAEAVHLPLSGQPEPLDQMLNYLSDKNMLLLLDNFEPLMEQGGPAILLEILTAAPAVKLLLTSRQALNLQEEWLYPLQGLPVPAMVQTDDSQPAGAVELFVARARQLRPNFSLADQPEAVLQICQLVEGMPLAVELAASWIKTLSCQAIAAEIHHSLSFLASPWRNVPDRHRSMAAVFDASWQLLTPTEQAVFQRLSVFRSGFQREAAEQVAGATVADLKALVDKSLLWRESGDRYHLHDLLRQYGQEKLQAAPESFRAAYQAHCRYYADFLDRRRVAIESGKQRQTIAEIDAELDNIRAARQWAADHQCLPEIQKSSHTFANFCHFQSRYLEGAKAFERDLASLESREPVGQAGLILADILVRLGWFYIRLGRFEESTAVLTRSQALFAALEAAPYPGSGTDFLPALAILATIRGELTEALRLGHQSRQANEARRDYQNLAFAHYALTGATLAQGDYDAARQHARQAAEVAKQAGNHWFLAYCLNEWGNVARAMGDYTEAEQHFQESYRIRETFDDPEGMAVALNHLGEIALRRADFLEAQRRYRDSLAIYRQINDKGGLAAALHGLGQSTGGRKAYPAAAQYFRQALAIAAEIQFLPLIWAIVVSIGELFLQVGLPERGLELLTFVRDQPAGDRETKDRTGQVLQQYTAKFDPEQVPTAPQPGQQSNLETIIATIQSDLVLVVNQARPKAESTPAADPTAGQPLLEPLTERELEVLRLMAAGRSNREIGQELVLALGSVKWYASQIYGKLQVKNRTEAAARARQLNLL
jgi:predicted ATPase/DNA-binding CsgD family transcriptional regulator